MILSDVQRVWGLSGRLLQHINSPTMLKRLKYASIIFRNQEGALKLLENSEIYFNEMLLNRPDYFQIIDAPYMDATWKFEQRIEKLINHQKSIDEKYSMFNFKFDEIIELYNLSDLGISDYRIIIDKPTWFHREGLLSINIFKCQVRIFTLSFSIQSNNENYSIFIGGIQGRNLKNILDDYRNFTKLTHGMRPRDFIIELIRILARVMGINQIMAISDECRHQRHPYFGKNTDRPLPANYNEIWADRGGVRTSESVWILPLHLERDIQTIAAKKRAMYKKRYHMLTQIEANIKSNFPQLMPVHAFQAG